MKNVYTCSLIYILLFTPHSLFSSTTFLMPSAHQRAAFHQKKFVYRCLGASPSQYTILSPASSSTKVKPLQEGERVCVHGAYALIYRIFNDQSCQVIRSLQPIARIETHAIGEIFRLSIPLALKKGALKEQLLNK